MQKVFKILMITFALSTLASCQPHGRNQWTAKDCEYADYYQSRPLIYPY
jgi:hypothetical protein